MTQKIAAMQPYFLPNVNYFGLISEVDVFVFLDDAQISKRPWIKRNFFTLEGRIQPVSIPLKKHSDAEMIKDVLIHPEFNYKKLMKRFAQGYQKYPSWDNFSGLLEQSFETSRSIAELNIGLLEAISNTTSCERKFIRSSDLGLDKGLHKSEKLIRICETLGANHYVNNVSGIWQYSEEEFATRGIMLSAYHPTLGEEANVSYLEVLLKRNFSN